MLASLNWLGDLCSPRPDPERVADVLTSRGMTVDSVSPDLVPGDVVLDIDVPANRPDCLGHLGLARELAAALGSELLAPGDPPAASGDPVQDHLSVEIADSELCARYTARVVRGIRVGKSPGWVVARLEACGLRSINNVVDASNLVLLELGQPIHFFDLSRFSGTRILVRRAQPGERLRTLDGIDRVLDVETVVIADADEAVALGGIMGGAETEILPETRDVLIEAAWFDPLTVRRASRRLGIKTDASQRFERGADPEMPPRAQNLAARLLVDLAGGIPAPGILDLYPRPYEPPVLQMRTARAAGLLGFDPGDDVIGSAFDALGLRPGAFDSGTYQVRVPSWRVDLEREVDLIEEIARHVGYDRIPVALPVSGAPPAEGSTDPLEERCRDVLAHAGFHEAFNYAMLAAGEDADFVESTDRDPLKIENPISDQLALLRRSVLPGLLKSVDRNLRHGIRDVRLFEIGRVFLRGSGPGDLPREPLHAGLIWTGSARPPHWSGPVPEVALTDIAGVVEAVSMILRPGFSLQRRSGALPGFHPGQSMVWTAPDGAILARAGALHPDIRTRLDLPAVAVMLAEIDLHREWGLHSGGFHYSALPRVPSVSRDLSLILEPGVIYGDVLRVLRSVEPPAPVEIEVVDRYDGPPLAEGEVSLTVRVILQPFDETLTDPQSEGYRLELVDVLERSGKVRLRT